MKKLEVSARQIRKESEGFFMKKSQILPNTSRLGDLQAEFDLYQMKHFPKRSSAFFALELCGEAGELANLEKKKLERSQ